MKKSFFLLTLTAAAALFAGVRSADASNGSKNSPQVDWTLADHPEAIDTSRTEYQYDDQTQEFTIHSEPGVKYSSLWFFPDLVIKPNMIWRFDARRNVTGDGGGSFAFSFTTASGKKYYSASQLTDQWTSFSCNLSSAKSVDGESFLPGETIEKATLYLRNYDLKPDLDMNFIVRNLRFTTEAESRISEEAVVSYSAFPHFQWPRQETRKQILQYSQTPDFSNDKAVHTVETDDPEYVPENALASGDWYWRYYQHSSLADRWSDIQRIYIPEHAHHFRLPEIDTKALGKKAHPRFAALAADDYAEKLSDDETRARFTRLIQTRLPDDFEPRWTSSLTLIDWIGQISDRIIKIGLELKDMGAYLMVTHDETMKAPARERLFEAVAWDPEGASSVRGNDLSAANFLIGMCWLFDALYDDLTPAERETVLNNIELRGRQFAKHVIPFTLNPAQNHSYKKTEAVGISAITMLGHREEAGYWFKATCNIFAYRILPVMGFEGENQEGISYWRYGGQMIADYADVLLFFCGVNLYEHPWLKNTAYFPLYCIPPGGYAISFADQHFYGNHWLRGPYVLYGADRYLQRLTLRTGFPYGAWYLGSSVPPGSVEQRPPVDLEPSILWSHIGWVQFNTCLENGFENVAVGLHAGKYFAAHQHADQNGFVINAYGDKLAIDGGYYDWYGSAHFTGYAVQTVAHNTILVNGEGQAWKKPGADGHIDTFYSSVPYDYTVGDASDPEIYGGTLRRFKRKLLFIKPGFVVIHDRLAATEKPAQFSWMIHSHTDDPIPFDRRSRTFSIVRPLARLDGWFLFPKDAKLGVKKSFTIMPSEKRANKPLADEYITPEWTLSADVKAASGETDYLAVMQISKTGAAVPAVSVEPFETDTALGAILHEGDRTWKIVSRKTDDGASSLNAEGLSTDADIACVELTGAGAVQTAFIGQGTQLAFNDKPVLSLPGITNAHFNVQEEWKSKRLEPVSLVEGLPPFDAYAMQMNDGTLYLYSAKLSLSSDTDFVMTGMPENEAVYVHVNEEIHAVPESGEFSVKKGGSFLTISSRADLGSMKIAIKKD